MRRRMLGRRYGHSRAHLPRSPLSLEQYEHEVEERLSLWNYVPRGVLSRKSAFGEKARLMLLDGWRKGRNPRTIADDIEQAFDGSGEEW